MGKRKQIAELTKQIAELNKRLEQEIAQAELFADETVLRFGVLESVRDGQSIDGVRAGILDRVKEMLKDHATSTSNHLAAMELSARKQRLEDHGKLEAIAQEIRNAARRPPGVPIYSAEPGFEHVSASDLPPFRT